MYIWLGIGKEFKFCMVINLVQYNRPDGGKGGLCMRLTTSPPSRAKCHGNLGASTSWNPLGHTGPVTGLLHHKMQLWQYCVY